MGYPKVPKWPCPVKLYRIFWENYPEDVGYIGHTRRILLSQRMPGHRGDAKQGKKSLINQKIRERGKFEYELLETIFCNNFDEARTHEKRWKRQLKANLNMNNPIQTEEEMKEWKRIWRSKPENKVKSKALYSSWYAKPENIARVKAYQAEYQAEYIAKPENKARVKAYKAEYNAKPEVRARKKAIYQGGVRVKCNCGVELRRDSLLKHKKSKRHLKKIQNLQKE